MKNIIFMCFYFTNKTAREKYHRNNLHVLRIGALLSLRENRNNIYLTKFVFFFVEFYEFGRNNDCSRLHFKFLRDNISDFTVWLEYYDNIIKRRPSQGTAGNTLSWKNEINNSCSWVIFVPKNVYYVKQIRFGFIIRSKLFFLTKKNWQQNLLGFFCWNSILSIIHEYK